MSSTISRRRLVSFWGRELKTGQDVARADGGREKLPRKSHDELATRAFQPSTCKGAGGPSEVRAPWSRWSKTHAGLTADTESVEVWAPTSPHFTFLPAWLPARYPTNKHPSPPLPQSILPHISYALSTNHFLVLLHKKK